MRNIVKNLIRQRGLEISIYVILVIIILNGILMLSYRKIISDNVALKNDINEITNLKRQVGGHVNRADMALRGYMLAPSEQILRPLKDAMDAYPKTFSEMESLLLKHGYDISSMEVGKDAYEEYMNLLNQMVSMVEDGRKDEVIEMLKSDPGYDAWEVYNPMVQDITNFVNELSKKSDSRYKSILRNILISQILLLVFSIPFLIIIARKLRRSDKNRKHLFERLDNNHKEYLFNPKQDNGQYVNEELVINDLVGNLQKASQFINSITDGDYEVQWEGLDKNNWDVNEDTLAGELVKMRDQMIKVKKEDDIRLWKTEGFSKFGDIIRSHHNDLKKLSVILISELVKYLEIKQGGLFVLNDENEGEEYLELLGCYAYEREKFMEKKIGTGEGLVGQCYMEKEPIYITNVPQDYVKITSGLGEVTPSSLLLVPLKTEEKVVGVVELASLKEFKEHEIEFMKELGETIASAIDNVKTNENTRELLERTQQQAEEMRAQEEEMRQNMEELQATQESLNRESQEKEKFQAETERAKNFLQKVINALPDPIFVKDRDHKFVIINDALCEFNDWDREKVMGKTDMDFFPEEEAKKMVDDEEKLFATKQDLDVETTATRKGRITHVIDKKRIIEDDDGNQFLVGINHDISHLKEIESELSKEKYLMDALMNNIPDSIYYKDRASKFIRVSQSMASLFNVTDIREVEGKSDFDFFGIEHAQQAYDDEQKIIKTEKPVIDHVEKETWDDGSVSWVSTTKMPLRDLEGNVVGTFGISRSITHIKQLEIESQKKIGMLERELSKKQEELEKLKK